ncbi:MAG: membrane protein insertase YidC [Alphaproteobacteria bacterium]|nr:membrane protein insertase YidC [Alphaproteobacteria bacterium]
MNNENFLLAVGLSIAILVGFHYFYEKPQLEKIQHRQTIEKTAGESKAPAAASATEGPERDRAAILAEGSRLRLETPELRGSIDLKGARLDDLELVKYRETVAPDSPKVVLLSPAGSAPPHPAYYAGFGWLGTDVPVPDENTLWKTGSSVLTPEKPARLTWDNGQGLTFERTISIDDHFMFTIKDVVKNGGDGTATLYPFGLVARRGNPATASTYILHEGPIGVLNGTLKEYKYEKLMDASKESAESSGGWLGITDKYWLVALIPQQDEKITASFIYDGKGAPDPKQGVFQTDFRGTAVSLAPGASAEQTTRLFAGAKQVRLLDRYQDEYRVPLFDRAIDFGWYYYLTKPFLYLLDFLGGALGNFGWAILIFTIMLKLLTLPLSLKSYRSMARMKTLQPQLKALQERHKDDKQRQSMEMMEMYKREKVNPLSGCLPTLIQIPIFFALYKVLYVGIELRQAPLFGWIKDLSVPDPTSVLTLFGALDWSFLPHIGVWPILMGLSMFMQQRLSPQPADKTQAQVFQFLPIIFTFMMSNVAVGLIFYWTLSNLLGLGQQWYIMHKAGGHKA